MQVKIPGKFHFNEGKKPYVVLMLHGFTGNTSDVRQLGRYLEKHDIPSYSFNYEGHGEAPEKILKSSPYIWYKQVVDTYDELKKQYDRVFVVGLSIGGVLGLRLTLDREVEALATVCSPMSLKTNDELLENFKTYARMFKSRFEQKDEGEIEKEIDLLSDESVFEDIRSFIMSVRDDLDEVYVPMFIAQGEKDVVIDQGSAKIIYDTVDSDDKNIIYYKDSGHVLTLDKDKETFFEDYYDFIKEHI
ncbi:alpha/beta hydrolase [Phocicoccus schoeneichii]|uniref:alpha/beta hydrolase n=1 Tax=Phocicoccus schoeneichii TaxID=1812261 RepID=UPI003D14D119